MEAEKLALEVKLAEQKFADEMECLRAERQQRAKILELKKKAEELRLEYEFEDAIAMEGMSNNSDVDKELLKLPVDDMSDRVSRLDKNTAENDVVDKPPIEPTNFTKPELAKDELSEPCEKSEHGQADMKTGPKNPSVEASNIDKLLEKMLPAFVKIVRPSVQKFNGNPLEFSKFKAAFKVEVDSKEVYDATEKLKFLLDSVEGSAKSCLAKFMPGSDRYEEAWTALEERFGRVDTVVSAAKKRIDQFPVIVKENSGQIRQYQEIVSELIGVFKEHKFVHELNSQIPEECVVKLPVRLCGRWAEFVEGKPKLSTWSSFASWLEKEAKISESKQRWMPEKREWKRTDPFKSDRRKTTEKSTPGLFAGVTAGESSRTRNGTKCPVHQSTNHALQECKRFEGMSTSEKEKVVEENRLCLRCLLPGHRLSKCYSKNRCKVRNCDMRHHTLVHEVDLKFIERAKAKRELERVPEVERDNVPTSQEDINPPPNQAVEPQEQCYQSAYSGHETGGRALVEVLPVVIFGETGKRQVMALRDSGCNTTLMDERLALLLGLQGKEVDLELQGVNAQKVFTSQHIKKCSVARVGEENIKYSLRDVKTIPDLNGPDQKLKWSTIKHKYAHLKDLDLRDTDTGPVQLIIGTNNSDLILPKQIAKPSGQPEVERVPYAVETLLGWAVTNWLPGERRVASPYSGFKVYERSSVEDEELKQLVMAQSEIEALGVVKVANPTRSIEDKRALSLMERTTGKKEGEDAYVSGLLWREENPSLPNNYDMAKRRLQSLEKKFANNPEIKERYAKSIEDDIEKGYVKKLSKDEVQCDSSVVWYLPHRFVINPKKPDRLRRVYDASAKFMGQSLNDKIYTGPDLLSSLFGVFLRFCEGRIAMAADVKEMYHMLHLPDSDKPAVRFLWRESSEEEPSVYQFERTVFGEVSAPSRANYTMRRNADENGADLPLGVRAVYKHFYMDDGLPSTNSREEAIAMREQMTELLRRGGFRLHKWLTNDPEVLATIPEQDRSPRFLELSEDKLPTDRALGIIWDAQEDVLKFTGLSGDPGTTKRKILSQAFSVWDPRGLLLPFSIRSKIILQNLNRMKCGWDDELRESDLREWREWYKEAEKLDEVEIPRALLSQDKSIQETALHVFCDASQEAYGACAYLRQEFEDGTVESRLVAGKGRVAPLKVQSICRLELMGALVAVRLAETLVSEMMTKIEKITFWSDSTTVLHWIHQMSSTYKAFVGNRVSEIHSIMSNLEAILGAGTVNWRYVPSESNPADDITRGQRPAELSVGHRYNDGPNFLYEVEELWPENKVQAPCEKDNESEKKKRWAGASQAKEILLGWKKYSSLAKLRRVTAYVMRFANNTRAKKEARLIGPLTSTELRAAQNYLVKRAQVESFSEEIQCLEMGREVHKKSRIKSLDPKMEDGFLVVGGRLQKAHCLPYKARHPKIIDSHHELAQLIIEEMHHTYHHPPTEHLLNQIRQEYWIIHCRQTVRNVKFKCNYCYRQTVKPQEQRMGNLPECRLEPGMVFRNTGVDFFGPMLVKERRSEVKVYGCLFTCLSTRACHLELVDDLSTDHFIMALKRFIARRGRPQSIYSDNGSNFVGADNELRKCIKQLDEERVQNFCAPRQIEWNFQPPSAPHFGGAWERLVQCTKKTLKAILANRIVSKVVLSTALAEAEGILNSRPITHVSNDAGDIEALTPNHFLLMRANPSYEDTDVSDREINSTKVWRQSQVLANFFWRRFTKEYLPSLTERKKWKEKKQNLKEGDVVLVAEPNQPRGVWPLGKIVSTYPGQDGMVRAVTVRTQTGEYKRPVTKLCLLEEA